MKGNERDRHAQQTRKRRGPAFPGVGIRYNGVGIPEKLFYPGMTLRQWYAGQALVGELANSAEGPYLKTGSAELAKRCFLFADAMIAHEKREAQK